jgi:hypothetical protein
MANRIGDIGIPVETQGHVATVSENLSKLTSLLREIENNTDAAYNSIHGTCPPDATEPVVEGIKPHVEHLIRMAERIKEQSYCVFTSLAVDHSVAIRKG